MRTNGRISPLPVSLSLSLSLSLSVAFACVVGCAFDRHPGVNEPLPDAGPEDQRGTYETVPRGPCTGLQCQVTTCTLGPCTVPACTGGAQTTVSGIVYDPAGKVPLYNVNVYVPNAPLMTLSEGATCDCETSISGNPVVSTTTNSKGEFTLTNVPVGTNIPLVVQVGKWRREVVLPSVSACTNTAADAALTRLPRNRTEGHIPKIALTTGGADALECLLLKIGLEPGEFTPEAEPGRVNFFAGGLRNGAQMANNSPGTNAYAATMNGGAPFTDAETWWETGANLNKYDIVLHSCEGVERPTNKSANARQALQAYADAGGRVFASHWHNYWIESGTAPWPSVATFSHQGAPSNPFTALIYTTGFPKGVAFSEWLVNVGASTVPGELVIKGAKRTLASVGGETQQWIYSSNPASVQYMSFNTPVRPAGSTTKQCGKVVFSDLHVSAGSGAATDDASSPMLPFPSGCRTTDLSPQEKALEFMLFDLSTCVNIPIIP